MTSWSTSRKLLPSEYRGVYSDAVDARLAGQEGVAVEAVADDH